MDQAQPSVNGQPPHTFQRKLSVRTFTARQEHVMTEPMKRTILERFEVPDSNYETVMMFVEIAPAVNSGLHTHRAAPDPKGPTGGHPKSTAIEAPALTAC